MMTADVLTVEGRRRPHLRWEGCVQIYMVGLRGECTERYGRTKRGVDRQIWWDWEGSGQ